MMKNLLLYLIFTLLSGFSAQADLNNVYFADLNSDLISSDTTFYELINNEVKAIDQWKLIGLGSTVLVQGEHSNLSADFGYFIYTPRQLVVTNQYDYREYKNIYDLLTTFNHEYGHLIFNKMMSLKIKEMSRLYQVGMKISDLSEKHLLASSKDEKQKISEEIKSLYQQKLYADKQLIDSLNLIMPYNELFADIVAVYRADQPEAIYQALLHSSIGFGEQNLLMARNFNNKIDLDQWSHNEEHIMFGPVRSILGKESCWPKTEQEKSENLRFFAEQMINIISQKLDQTVRLSKKYDLDGDQVRSANRELIEIFKTKCK